MTHYTSISQEIEAEYEIYLQNPDYNLNTLYEKLFVLLKRIIARDIHWNAYADEGIVEDLAQEALLAIAQKGMDSFEKRGTQFTTYCGVIAKNKAIDWVRKHSKVVLSVDEEMEKDGQGLKDYFSYGSPEKQILECEYRLEQIEMVKKYLKLLMDWPQKPYRTVGCGYTMVLFQKFHPDTKELTSPKWAFDTLKEHTVEEGADGFVIEMQEWFPNVSFSWGVDFLNAMDEKENEVYISDMVFGERFQAKDFENWSRRLQPKIKQCLLESKEDGFSI